PLNVRTLERLDERSSGVVRKRVALKGALSGEQIRRDGDEAVSRELVGDAPDPSREAEDLINHHDDGRLCASLRVHDPGANAVTRPRPDHRPFAVPWRRSEALRHRRRVWRKARGLLQRYFAAHRRCGWRGSHLMIVIRW